jgi:hypothetical protein
MLKAAMVLTVGLGLVALSFIMVSGHTEPCTEPNTNTVGLSIH